MGKETFALIILPIATLVLVIYEFVGIYQAKKRVDKKQVNDWNSWFDDNFITNIVIDNNKFCHKILAINKSASMIKNQTLFPCLSSSDKGFTLIELFIIVVIIGILTTLFISKYKSIIGKNTICCYTS